MKNHKRKQKKSQCKNLNELLEIKKWVRYVPIDDDAPPQCNATPPTTSDMLYINFNKYTAYYFHRNKIRKIKLGDYANYPDLKDGACESSS